MIFALALLSIGLAAASKLATDRPTRLFLAAACLLNLVAAAHMLVTDYPYALRLQPQADAQPGEEYDGAMPDNRR